MHPRLVVAYVALFGSTLTPGDAKEKPDPGTFSLWRDPGDIASRDLFHGAGGKQRAPDSGPYFFVEEDRDGVSPKFVVKDSHGVKWKVKLGDEARPETASTRFVWAVGYFTDEDYFVPAMRVQNMPKLRRGGEFVSSDGLVKDARWERMDHKKLGQWKWADNPFDDTRELDGLRVMMSLLNNWDLKDSQNSIYLREGFQEYVVSDMGASLGATGSRWPQPSVKGDLEEYSRSRFVRRTTDNSVTLAAPSWPMMFRVLPTPPAPYPLLTAPVKLFGGTPAPDTLGYQWMGRRIPREHVQWITGLLKRLTPQQIRDAFRAAHYSPEEIEGFSVVVESRIAQLNDL